MNHTKLAGGEKMQKTAMEDIQDCFLIHKVYALRVS